MKHRLSLVLALLGFAAQSIAVRPLSAQAPQADRVPANPESTPALRLPGHVAAWARAAGDLGPADPGTSLHLTFVLTRAPAQEAAFQQLLADQQDPASPRFHRWLIPAQTGVLYGPTAHDLAALTSWLTARGLTVAEVAPSRLFVTATGSASTVAAALSTSFHRFAVDGETHLSATLDPALPSAFTAILGSIVGLVDSLDRPAGYGQAVSAPFPPLSGHALPRDNFGTAHYIAPGDFANIFDLAAPYNANLTGIGQRVAIIGRSRVLSTDISEFEANTGLALNLPNIVIPGGIADPGYSGDGDQLEATLDVDRVLATAPAAQVDLVILPNTAGGIYSAAQYAVNTLNDPVMNISFGGCEYYNGLSGDNSWDTLFAQAAAQGISVFISASDSGAATCDSDFTTPPLIQVRSINTICASSHATCVGGTEFADAANPSAYWGATNSASLTSAFGYIPEGAWNEPTITTAGVVSYVVAAGGGGASTFIAKPTWQIGVGVPADGARDVPDVSFPSSGHDAYYACYAGGGGNCAAGSFEFFYGTSAAAPAMAAVAALLNQRTGARQGNLNPALYALAANPANNVFHDATVASSAVSGCAVTLPSMCNNSIPSPTSLAGGLTGYALTAGYDQATGWGSIDVGNLLSALGPIQKPASIALSASSPSIFSGNTVTFSAAISAAVAGTPTGWVQFFSNGVELGNAIALPASGKVATPALLFSVALTDSITAIYSGDATFAAAKSAVLPLIVASPGFSITPSPASITLAAGATTGNTVTLTYTSLGGYAGTIAQGCTVTTNSGALSFIPVCSFTVASLNLAAGGTVTGTLLIGSTTRTVQTSSRTPLAEGPSFGPPGAPWPSTERPAIPGIALGALLLTWLPNRRCRGLLRSMSLLAAACLAAACLSGCGSKAASSTQTTLGTPAGSYTISLNSSSSNGITVATPPASIALTIQ